ncbi:unannotated protein [freshwater metagenome]|uniref:Unannotated protein n=1 Tax=freshwater metagenome TaxID=449393 RepID=A0A6J6MPB4_9ZZZZ
MNSDYRSVFDLDQLDEPSGTKDLALAVSTQVVVICCDGVAMLCTSLSLGYTNASYLWLAVGDLWNVHVSDDYWSKASEFFGNKNAVLETTMCKLKARGDVSNCEDAVDVGAQALVNEHPTALHGNTLFFKAHTCCIWSATDSNKKQIRIKGFSIFKRDVHAGIILSSRGKASAY